MAREVELAVERGVTVGKTGAPLVFGVGGRHSADLLEMSFSEKSTKILSVFTRDLVVFFRFLKCVGIKFRFF